MLHRLVNVTVEAGQKLNGFYMLFAENTIARNLVESIEAIIMDREHVIKKESEIYGIYKEVVLNSSWIILFVCLFHLKLVLPFSKFELWNYRVDRQMFAKLHLDLQKIKKREMKSFYQDPGSRIKQK